MTNLIVQIALVIATFAVITSIHRVAGVLLIIVALSQLVIVAFSPVGETRWFRVAITALLAIALGGSGAYLGWGHISRTGPSRPAAGPVSAHKSLKVPKLTFENSSSRVPYCSSYVVQASGPLPHGYQMVMFHAETGGGHEVIGGWNFDSQTLTDGNGTNRYIDLRLYVGAETKATGFTAVIVVALIADREAQILEATQANASKGWYLRSLPALLASSRTYVTRTSGHALC